MGLSPKQNEYPYRRYEQQNQGFMTGLASYSVQTIYVTAVNVLIVYIDEKFLLFIPVQRRNSCPKIRQLLCMRRGQDDVSGL